jgi:hypothetical protein
MAGKAQTRFFLEAGKLFFQLRKAPLGDPSAPWTDIIVKAELDHAKRYRMDFQKFLKENPDFVSEWDEFKPAPVVVVEEVKEPVEELPEPTPENVEELIEVAKKSRSRKSS